MTNKELKRYGLRYSAYDGAYKRRFCIFERAGITEHRREFDTRKEAMHWAKLRIHKLRIYGNRNATNPVLSSPG